MAIIALCQDFLTEDHHPQVPTVIRHAQALWASPSPAQPTPTVSNVGSFFCLNIQVEEIPFRKNSRGLCECIFFIRYTRALSREPVAVTDGDSRR
jgi:hypothetical protein